MPKGLWGSIREQFKLKQPTKQALEKLSLIITAWFKENLCICDEEWSTFKVQLDHIYHWKGSVVAKKETRTTIIRWSIEE